jgi:phenylalanine-4-hydroxylase
MTYGRPTEEERNKCTQAAGLVAIHPIAEALKDEYFYFAWMLRHEAFLKFGYDPDAVFSEKVDELGFR